MPTPQKITLTLTQDEFNRLMTQILSYQEWIEDIIKEQGMSDLTPLEGDLQIDLSRWLQVLSQAAFCKEAPQTKIL